MVRWQLAKKHAGTHKQGSAAEIRAPGKDVPQKGSGSARHHATKRLRSSAVAVRPMARSRAATPLTCPRRFASSRCVTRFRPRSGWGLIVIDSAASKAKTKDLTGRSSTSWADNVLFIDGAELNPELPPLPATFRTWMCCRSRASTSTTSCGAISWS
jgi:hypothetical protein